MAHCHSTGTGVGGRLMLGFHPASEAHRPRMIATLAKSEDHASLNAAVTRPGVASPKWGRFPRSVPAAPGSLGVLLRPRRGAAPESVKPRTQPWALIDSIKDVVGSLRPGEPGSLSIMRGNGRASGTDVVAEGVDVLNSELSPLGPCCTIVLGSQMEQAGQSQKRGDCSCGSSGIAQQMEPSLLNSDGASSIANCCPSDKPFGSAVLLECRGGPQQGPDGWRRDTLPICEALTGYGFTAKPMFYSDIEYDEVYHACAAADAVIVRINPATYEGVTQSKLDGLLREMDSIGKAVMSHPDVMLKMGAKDALVKIRNLSCGMPDTFAYYDIPSFKYNFPKTIATGTRVLKQNRGSQGQGIWVCKVKEGQSGPITGATILELQEAFDNHKEEQTVDGFMKFCERYIMGENGQLIDQRFLPRISEGELRVNMIYDTPVAIVHKKPVDGGISATLASGAKYVSYEPDDPKFEVLMDNFIQKDLSKIMEALDMEGEPLPLIWTTDFILGDKVDGADTYFVGEFNCSCVGITQQLHLSTQVAEAAIRVAASCDCCNLL